MDNKTIWNIIDKYFEDNPQALVRHHIDSYNDFFKHGIYQIFRDKNPVVLYSKLDPVSNEYMSQCKMYMGGKDGSKIYFGKPVIYDKENPHYMYPNEARLRDMNYAMTIHYDVELEFIDKLMPGEMPTVIGGELQTLNETGDIVIEGGDFEGQEQEGGSISVAVANEIERDLSNGSNVALEKELMMGGASPKATKKKKKRIEEVRLQMTTKAAGQLRDLAETNVSGNTQTRTHVLKKIFLGKFPIMVQSDFCILKGLLPNIMHNMGECINDLGGYFIIDGNEKTVISQEKFADNMLYIKKVNDDKYLYSAELRSVSENVSKPIRTFSVKMCAPTPEYTNKQIVVNIPNVRAPVPLFIVFRALGIISDKDIISYCLLDIEKNESFVDLFIPSVHDGANIMNQQNALEFIALLTKGKGVSHALEILTDYFLPHVGETNYIAKAYALGDIVFRLLSVYTGSELPTDRDNFKYKRVELIGSLLNDLFREYWNIQLKNIHLEFEKRLYYNEDMYENNLFGLITQNYVEVFKQRELEKGFQKAFKGNWGAYSHTKRIGIIQDLNRLSFNSAMNHLRKTNLPLDSSVKLVGPRVLHNSQWGYLDPIDTPDGGNIGLHKHLSISTYITKGVSREPMIQWMREKWAMKLIEEYTPQRLSNVTKVLINGFLVGAVDEPIECVKTFRLYRRNALIPIYASAAFDIRLNTIYVYTDGGRLCRPIFYKDENTDKFSFQGKSILKKLQDNEFTYNELISGFNKKRETIDFDAGDMKIYKLNELYEGIESETNPAKINRFLTDKAVLDYIDNNESEYALIAMDPENFQEESNDANYTHCEIHNSFIFGMMSNLIIFPENNPGVRNSFSCGQSKQACSLYHTNYQVRMDKTAVLLNYGQIPLVKSRFLDYINHEENSYGENVIVAIACYTGYNVEDAILINEGALKRGLFQTTYISSYQLREEIETGSDMTMEKRFINVQEDPNIIGTRVGSDYSKLDEHGLIKEGTIVNEDTALIGGVIKTYSNVDSLPNSSVSNTDNSIFPKKQQKGIVDKVFITDDEEGKRIAKVRVIEKRTPAIGDKMASRAGQKGTIGMVIPECDMPFTSDGLRPDIIINPHAIPTRMTIGQLVECITGKACAMLGGFGDCTAFNNKGSKIHYFGELLTKQGFHCNGNEILYNGMDGKQMETEIFIGPTYYMRLKHMVKDKINSRRKGPTTKLTKQSVGGRANGGGLRIGEMERDTLISHGIDEFLRESLMERGDKYYLAICNHTGIISICNPSKKIFVSPMLDGPLKFSGSLENEDLRLEHVTEFGRNFSIVCIPYSFKLFIQELQAMNIQLRVITEDNIDQIESMSYSDNIAKVTGKKIKTAVDLMTNIRELLNKKIEDRLKTPEESVESPPYNPVSPPYDPSSPNNYPGDGESNASSESYHPITPDSYESNKIPQTPPDTPPEDFSDNEKIYPSENFMNQSIEEGEIQEGGGNRYEINERVCMRNVEDNYPTRPWKVTHVGPTFLTIHAIDKTGLSDEQAVNVVMPFDIYPEKDAHIHAAKVPQHVMQPYANHSNENALPSTQPTVVIAPKFYNNSTDHSTNEGTSNQPDAMPIDNFLNSSQSPEIVVKSNAGEGTSTKESKNDPIDFNNLVIKKV